MTGKILAVCLSLAFTGALAFAQGEAKTVKFKGYLIDNMCAGAAGEDKDYAEEAREHNVSCSAMPHCAKAGFAVAEGHKLYKLDDAGNKLASEIIKTTKEKKGLMVEVEGTLDGTTLHATKLAEVATK